MDNRKFIYIFLVVAVIILIGFLLFSPAEFENKNLDMHVSGVNKSSISAPVPYNPTTATTVPKQNWQKYSNEEYGFSIEYPSEYVLEVDTPSGDDTLFSLLIAPKNSELQQQGLSLSVRRDNISGIVNEFLNSGIEGISIEDISFNGFTGKLIQSEYGFTGDLENHVLLENTQKQVIYIYYYQYTGGGSPMNLPNSVLDSILQSVRPSNN